MARHLHLKKTFAQIQAQWNEMQTLDPKKKLKAMRGIGSDLLRSYDGSGVNIAQLEFYLTILKSIILSRHDNADLSVLRSKMIQDQLRISGNGEPQTLLSKKSEVMADCPHFYLGDPSYFIESQNISLAVEKNYAGRLNLINEGKLYEIGTGGDHFFNIELRLVDYSEPCLTASEMKFAIDSTETVIMHIPNGVLCAGSIFYDGVSHITDLPVAPGNYKMSIFYIYKEHAITFCVVLCNTSKEAKNNYQSMPRFSEDTYDSEDIYE